VEIRRVGPCMTLVFRSGRPRRPIPKRQQAARTPGPSALKEDLPCAGVAGILVEFRLEPRRKPGRKCETREHRNGTTRERGWRPIPQFRCSYAPALAPTTFLSGLLLSFILVEPPTGPDHSGKKLGQSSIGILPVICVSLEARPAGRDVP